MAIRTFIHDPNGPHEVYGAKGRFEVSYEGAVITTRERNYHDDSDFYAIVWDEAAGVVKSVDYATTRAWTYGNSATADITPENEAKAHAYLATLAFGALKAADEAAAATPAKGKWVKVVRGRKVPKGTEGTVIWYGAGKAYSWYDAKYGPPKRVGLKTADGTVHWTAASNVEVLDPASYRTPEETLRARATADRGSGVFLSGGTAAAGLALVA